MPAPSPTQIVDIVLNRRQVYDLNTDTCIREMANRLTPRALLELLARVDDRSADFTSSLAALLRNLPARGPSSLIAYEALRLQTVRHEPKVPKRSQEPIEHYLRLVFRDEQAAYYQFHLFPDLDAPYILAASRKRAGAIQHIRIEITHPEALQEFVELCRRNPHFLRVEESTAEEFRRAPSNAI